MDLINYELNLLQTSKFAHVFSRKFPTSRKLQPEFHRG